jgi:hypothetical protein
MALDLYDELLAILASLDHEGVEYGLAGALALAVHGAPRATTDIDLLIRAEAIDPALRVVQPLGFTYRARTMTFRGSGITVHRVTKVAGPETLTLDLLVVGPALEPVWASRIEVQVMGQGISVVSREGLITMKALAGRLRDLADIRRLEGDDDDEE